MHAILLRGRLPDPLIARLRALGVTVTPLPGDPIAGAPAVYLIKNKETCDAIQPIPPLARADNESD